MHREQSTADCQQKTKELIVDFRKKMATALTPVYISAEEVEQVSRIRLLGITITENLSWSSYVTILIEKSKEKVLLPEVT